MALIDPKTGKTYSPLPTVDSHSRDRTRREKVGDKVAVYFPPVFIELQRELLEPIHWDVRQELARQPQNELELQLLQLCTALNIAVDGEYAEEDLCRVAEACLGRLRERRNIVLNINTQKAN